MQLMRSCRKSKRHWTIEMCRARVLDGLISWTVCMLQYLRATGTCMLVPLQATQFMIQNESIVWDVSHCIRAATLVFSQMKGRLLTALLGSYQSQIMTCWIAEMRLE